MSGVDSGATCGAARRSGFFGLKLYSEAKQVKAHEEQAMQLLGGVTDLSNLDNLDTVSQQISQAKTETAAANEIAHGTLWNIASKAPVYGGDITTVQGMTSVGGIRWSVIRCRSSWTCFPR